MSDQLESTLLPVLPLRSGVVLPQMVVTLTLETDEARAAAAAAETVGGELLLVPQVEGRSSRVGVLARVESAGGLPGGGRALMIRATGRALVGAGVVGPGTTAAEAAPALWVRAEPIAETAPTERAVALARELRATFRALLERNGGRAFSEVLRGTEDPGALADLAGWWPDLSHERKVEVLEAVDVEARLELVLGWATEALAEAQLTDRIRSDVSEGMEKTQREFLLRRQLEAIRSELGEDPDDTDVVEGYRTKLGELADAGAAETVLTAIDKEVRRLQRTPEQAVEHGWIRQWLDTAFDVPWATRTDDDLDLGAARSVLDADHTGLDEVKERIVEFLAVRRLRASRQGSGEGAPAGQQDVTSPAPAGRRTGGAILALVGPPGVGKTSLGESVARALGREFVRVSLGGVRDEAEIRGHRRTYVGAQPGRIVRALTEAGTMNPVVLLDELDKVGSDWRGDPSSALLEVLDPAQNHTFRDHYLEVDLDLSDVLFLVTANQAELIPGPLYDRLEVINLDGYTEDEKVAIARDHLVGRQVAANGLRPEEVDIGDGALRRIVAEHTREAGVRSLERTIGKLLRKVATRVAAEEAECPVVVDTDDVPSWLGRARFLPEVNERTSVPGVATGLAVTGAGGDVLFVEATTYARGAGDATAGLTVTGQLGDVMRESAEIALSFVRSRAVELGIDPADLDRRFHVHFPAGAVPKDGPSAGVTMTTALVSLLTRRPVRSEVGMTGEVTLQGRVLPIGGVKQKVLAAHRAGLTEVVLPRRNEADLDDVPESVRHLVTIHLVDDVRDVLRLALEPAPAVTAAA